MAITTGDISPIKTTHPSANAEAVTPADSDLSFITRGIYIGGSGNLVVVMAGTGATVTFNSVSAGIVYPIMASQIKAATTCTNVVALY